VDEDKLKAYATITFDNCFIVRDLKVISGNKGYFIAMPSKKRKDGTFRDVAHPLNNETRRMLVEKVLREYRREVDDATPRRPDREVPEMGTVTSLESRRSPKSPPERNSGVAAVAASVAPEARPAVAAAAPRDKTLEEVQELHLSDSFWSVS
jgi:stage V sporulation protein G